MVLALEGVSSRAIGLEAPGVICWVLHRVECLGGLFRGRPSMWSGGWPSRQHPATPVCQAPSSVKPFSSIPSPSPSLRNHLFTTSTIDIHGHLVQFPSLEHYRHSLFPFHYAHFNTPIANFSLLRGCRRFFRARIKNA
jgi:hypothetical protein